MMVPIEKLFLGRKKLQQNPDPQKKSSFYKRVRDSIKKRGMVNPLLCIQEGERYKICGGNNRYLAAHELGIKEVPIKIIMSEAREDLKSATQDYIPTEVEGNPFLRREYERRKNEF